MLKELLSISAVLTPTLIVPPFGHSAESAGREIACPLGANLRMVLLRARLPLYNGVARAIHCRGMGTCGTCAVRIVGAVSEPTKTELLRLGGVTYRDMEDEGILLMVAACSAKFSAPARYDDLLVLTTRVEQVGKVKIEHGYVLKRKADGALVARGKTTLGCISAEGKIIPLPPSITGIGS